MYLAIYEPRLRTIGQYSKLDFTERSKNILLFMCNSILMEGFYYEWSIFNIYSFSAHLLKRQRKSIFIEGSESKSTMYFK